ncbi:hypothetical protein R1flu_012215 [Riccia fluitans]|uniref:Uncharacterized protein n=1 Tax=Riccia fluitans TaxID=41844 RepID=A0ABD1ZB45_9MARC
MVHRGRSGSRTEGARKGHLHPWQIERRQGEFGRIRDVDGETRQITRGFVESTRKPKPRGEYRPTGDRGREGNARANPDDVNVERQRKHQRPTTRNRNRARREILTEKTGESAQKQRPLSREFPKQIVQTTQCHASEAVLSRRKAQAKFGDRNDPQLTRNVPAMIEQTCRTHRANASRDEGIDYRLTPAMRTDAMTATLEMATPGYLAGCNHRKNRAPDLTFILPLWPTAST